MNGKHPAAVAVGTHNHSRDNPNQPDDRRLTIETIGKAPNQHHRFDGYSYGDRDDDGLSPISESISSGKAKSPLAELLTN